MSLPSPAALQGFLDDIVDAAGHLGPEYRWLEPSAHTPVKRGVQERSSHADRDLSDTVRVTSPVRSKLEWAARNVVDARNRLLTARAALNDVAALLDPKDAPDQVERSLPHPADQGDLVRARQAQERRLERAEASGDWEEVTG